MRFVGALLALVASRVSMLAERLSPKRVDRLQLDTLRTARTVNSIDRAIRILEAETRLIRTDRRATDKTK